MKWRFVAIDLCHNKVYKVVIRLSLLYGMECWPFKKSHVQNMYAVEMRMLMDVSPK